MIGKRLKWIAFSLVFALSIPPSGFAQEAQKYGEAGLWGDGIAALGAYITPSGASMYLKNKKLLDRSSGEEEAMKWARKLDSVSHYLRTDYGAANRENQLLGEMNRQLGIATPINNKARVLWGAIGSKGLGADGFRAGVAMLGVGVLMDISSHGLLAEAVSGRQSKQVGLATDPSANPAPVTREAASLK